jgi:hypothetical protein
MHKVVAQVANVMFRTPWFDRGRTISDEGFSVKTYRSSVVYEEAGRKMSITSTPAPNGFDVFVDSIARWDDAPETSISAAERDRIAHNVRRALEFRGHEVELIGPAKSDFTR